MISLKCPSCERVLKVPADAAGKQAKCPCGQKVKVPVAASSSTSPRPTTSATSTTSSTGTSRTSTGTSTRASSSSGPGATITLKCECGRQLRAPVTAVGKAVKCPCGLTLPVADPGSGVGNATRPKVVASPVSAPAAPATPADDWLSELPTAGSFNAPAYPSAPMAGYTAPAYSPPAKPASVNPYLADAAASQQRAKPRVEYDGEVKSMIWTLVIVGVLTAIVNLISVVNTPNEVNELIGRGELDPADAGLAHLFGYVLYGSFVLGGVVLAILGPLVPKFPRTCTTLGLLLYLGMNGVMFMLDPTAIVRGVIIKAIIVISLIKATISAYQQ